MIWTDVLQTITLIFGSILIVVMISLSLPDGFGQIISTGIEFDKFSFKQAVAGGELKALARGFSLSDKTLIMMLLVGFTQFLTNQFDQTTIQRWCSAKSAKEARRSLYFLAITSSPCLGQLYAGWDCTLGLLSFLSDRGGRRPCWTEHARRKKLFRTS